MNLYFYKMKKHVAVPTGRKIHLFVFIVMYAVNNGKLAGLTNERFDFEG